MLELGFHFGHMRSRRDGRCLRFIRQTRMGQDIIDPKAFSKSILRAKAAASRIEGPVLFVADKASAARMPSHCAMPLPCCAGRWKPGALTNFAHGSLPEMPAALFLASLRRSKIAALEARKAGIPVFALCDTDADPGLADFPIPSNDDRPLIATAVFSEIFGNAAGALATP